MIPQINYTDKLNIDYRHFDSAGIEPRHEFGFGLSYTSFHYSDLSVETLIDFKHPPIGHIEPGGKTGLWEAAVRVKFNVQNTGRYDGHEVAQLYLVGFVSLRLILTKSDNFARGFLGQRKNRPVYFVDLVASILKGIAALSLR